MADFLLAESNHSPLAAAIRSAIDVGPNETVKVRTPEFNRPASWEPAMLAPDDARTWAGFTAADAKTLHAWGCRRWSTFTTEPPKDGKIYHTDAWFFDIKDGDTRVPTHELWLFPAEWYDSIPNGFPVTDINGCIELFERGKTDDDRRLGLLAFGILLVLGGPV